MRGGRDAARQQLFQVQLANKSNSSDRILFAATVDVTASPAPWPVVVVAAAVAAKSKPALAWPATTTACTQCTACRPGRPAPSASSADSDYAVALLPGPVVEMAALRALRAKRALQALFLVSALAYMSLLLYQSVTALGYAQQVCVIVQR